MLHPLCGHAEEEHFCVCWWVSKSSHGRLGVPACHLLFLTQRSSTAEDLAAQRIRWSDCRLLGWNKQSWRAPYQQLADRNSLDIGRFWLSISSFKGHNRGGLQPSALWAPSSFEDFDYPGLSQWSTALWTKSVNMGRGWTLWMPQTDGESVRRPSVLPLPCPLHAVLWAGPSSESRASICEFLSQWFIEVERLYVYTYHITCIRCSTFCQWTTFLENWSFCKAAGI